MATKSLQNFLSRLSENKNVQSVVNEFTKIGDELRKRGSELNQRWTEEKEKTLTQAQDQYHRILKSVGDAQTQLDKEVAKAVNKIRQSAADVEKNLEYYRKKAVSQKAKVEKLIKAKKKSAAKAKKSTVVKKAAKKTTSRKKTGKTS